MVYFVTLKYGVSGAGPAFQSGYRVMNYKAITPKCGIAVVLEVIVITIMNKNCDLELVFCN